MAAVALLVSEALVNAFFMVLLADNLHRTELSILNVFNHHD